MKINSCLISSFGKFKNYKIDFSDGFNIIYGDNEAGKSTVMSFIKMMFYGNGGRVSDLSRNLRLKYTPWDSPLMAGSIEFSEGGKNYRIEREFRGSNATDKITLTDLDLKTEVKIGSKGDIGSEIFGLSEAAFEKSVFVGTLVIPEKNSSAEGELNGKLSNLTSTGDEDISLELITGRLKKAKEKFMSKSGKIGLYDKGLANIQELGEELISARKAEAEAEELEAVIALKETEAAKITADGNKYFSIMKKAELFKKKTNLEKYISAYEQKQAAQNKLTLPNGTVADKNYAEAIKEARSLCAAAEKSLLEKQAEKERLSLEIEQLMRNEDSSLNLLSDEKKSLEEKIEKLEKQADDKQKAVFEQQLICTANGKKKSSNLPLLIIGPALTLICGVLTAAIPKNMSMASIPLSYLSIIGTLIGIILFILAFIIKRNNKNDYLFENLNTLQNELDSLLSEIALCKEKLRESESRLNEIFIQKSSSKALLESKQSELILKGEAALSAKKELFEKNNKLARLCEPFGSLDISLEIIENIEKLLSDISKAEVMINLAADSTNAASYEEAKKRLSDLNADETLKNLSAEEVASAKDEFKATTELSGKLKEELATLRGRLRNILSNGRTVPIIELERAELIKKTESQKAFCDSADIALEVLLESFSAMRQSFGGLLEEETSKIFSGICNNAYASMDISKDFDIKVNRDGTFGAKDWQFLSAGTADQAYLSLRLALIKLMSNENDSLPLIMDDPLANYDDIRAEAAIKYLKDYSNEHQLILFTCHNGIKNLAEKLGIKITNI